jgi:hypothetical protein
MKCKRCGATGGGQLVDPETGERVDIWWCPSHQRCTLLGLSGPAHRAHVRVAGRREPEIGPLDGDQVHGLLRAVPGVIPTHRFTV